MSKTLLAVLALFLFLTPLAAQSDPPPAGAGSNTSTASSQPAPKDANNQKTIEEVVFTHRGNLPDSPKPKRKSSDEDVACPGGEGTPCALLGGRLYYSDRWHITEHEKTWWDAFKTPGTVFSTTTLFASTIVDIEGTQHCLSAGTCRELNPIMGKTRAQQYGVAMPMDTFLTWLAVREKQHGRGVLPFFVLWSLSTVHLYYRENVLMPQAHH